MNMKNKPRVVWWSNMPTPYFINRFNAIAQRDNLDFEAWFNVEREPDRSWELNADAWKFKSRYIGKYPLPFGREMHIPWDEIRLAKPDVFVQEYDRSYLAFGHILAKAAARRTAFRVLQPPAWAKRTMLGEFLRYFLFRSVDGAKISGADAEKYACKYGLPKDRLFRVTQSIDVQLYQKSKLISDRERQAKRNELGLKGCVFIFVGRLFHGKGLENLIGAYAQLVREKANVSLLIVGDGPKEAEYRALTRNLPGVRFPGFIQAADLPNYYGISDVFVLPTLGDSHGLVIDEAMASGLPVITTKAAGDIEERLPDGKAGFVIPPNNTQELFDRMRILARDATLRKQFAQAAENMIVGNTDEKYAHEFEYFIDSLLQLPPRRTIPAWITRFAGKVLLNTSRTKNPQKKILSNDEVVSSWEVQ